MNPSQPFQPSVLMRRYSWALCFVFLLALSLPGCQSADEPGEQPPDLPPEVPPDDFCEGSNECSLRTVFGDPEELNLWIDGIFAVWWEPQFDHADDAQLITTQLKAIRRDCLDNLGMLDPPNPAAGYYYNVYIHHGENDSFPEGWGNGQGTDSNGMPFLTLPDGAHVSESNLYHEGFHIFQYSANSPGFAYSGDSQWYVESSAQWYMADKLPEQVDAFVEAGAMGANPHLTLWHSFSNEAPGDPVDWLYQVRQYGMHTYLFFLTSVAGVAPELITNGFYGSIAESPQEYHFRQVGGDLLRGHFADWAAHNTGGLDYLTPEQVERAMLELEWVADPENMNPYVLTLTDSGSEGQWLRPDEELTARGWGYNVIRVTNTQAATYTFHLDGDETGSDGAASQLQGRIVVVGSEGASYSALDMTSDVDGSASVAVSADDNEVFLVIAAVPEHFAGNQTYGYAFQIERD